MIYWLKENLGSICAPYESAITPVLGEVDWYAASQEVIQPNTVIDEVITISGSMTIEQYREACRDLFVLSDTDSDDRLNFAEFKAYYPSVRPGSTYNAQTLDGTWSAMYYIYDINQNGYVSWDEAWELL